MTKQRKRSARNLGTQYMKNRTELRGGCASTITGALKAAVQKIREKRADFVCIYRRKSGRELYHVHATKNGISIAQVR